MVLGAYFTGTFVAGCKKNNVDSIGAVDTSENISFSIPSGWPLPIYTFQNNPLTQQGFELGRKLFYEVRLSRDNSISCGSCHAQFSAFSHLDHSVSHGINGLLGTRNAQGLFNLAWRPNLFWDGGVANLEDQPLSPIENPVEMGEKMSDVIAELSGDAAYKQSFKRVFGDETISSQRIFKALAQFMATLVSNNSKYDKYIRGESGGELTQQEKSGLLLFRAKCASCHKEPLFTDHSFRNNGLMADESINDTGRAHVTAISEDRYKFMVPSLRNVSLTRPYMHDGRFTSLDAVLEHYRTGIVISSTLDSSLTSGISISEDEKNDIIAFLRILDDESFTKDKRFKGP